MALQHRALTFRASTNRALTNRVLTVRAWLRTVASRRLGARRLAARRLAAAVSVTVTLAVAAASHAEARVPLFPDATMVVDVPRPWVSKAYFVRSDVGQEVTFAIESTTREAPLFLLVLDEGASDDVAFDATIECDDRPPIPFTPDRTLLDEPLSGLSYRIVATASLLPTDEPCAIRIVRTAGTDARWSLSVGAVTIWLPGDLARVFGWRSDLRRWLEGP